MKVTDNRIQIVITTMSSIKHLIPLTGINLRLRTSLTRRNRMTRERIAVSARNNLYILQRNESYDASVYPIFIDVSSTLFL